MPGELRRHRSSSGSRRHISRSGSRRRSGCHRYRRLLKSERNLIAALFSVISIVTACTALAEPDWFALKGSRCRHANDNSLYTLGVYQFFYSGHFEEKSGGSTSSSGDGASVGAGPATAAAASLIYHYGPQANDLLKDCIDSHSLLVIRLIVASTFLSVICSMCAFTLDIMGATSNRLLRTLRRNGMFSILSLAFLVTVIALCYWCTALMSLVQAGDTKGAGHVLVSYAASFYIIVGAAAANVFAAASNLLQRWPDTDPASRDELLRPFADDFFEDGWPSSLHLPAAIQMPTEGRLPAGVPLHPPPSEGRLSAGVPQDPPPYVP